MASCLPVRYSIGCLCLVVLFLLPFLGKAQQSGDSLISTVPFKKNYFGLSAGIGFSGVRDNDFYNMGKMLGSPNFALIYQRNLLPQLGLRTGIGYVRKGDIYQFHTNNYAQNPYYLYPQSKIILNYLEIPILFTLQTPNQQKVVNPYMNVGVAYGIALGKTRLVTNEAVSNPDNFIESVGKKMDNTLDNSLVLGGGLKFNANHTSFFLEMQYSYSTSNVFAGRSHNNVLSMHLGFLLAK